MRKGNLYVISGPSGAGKGTLVAQLLAKMPDAWVSVSATTRNPREGEVDGVHYYFLDKEEFDRRVKDQDFLEWATYSGNQYGTLRSAVEDHITEGYQVILEIDVQGAFQIREQMPEAHLIFIEPPSMEVLKERLVGRGTESEEALAMRLKTAEAELLLKDEYDICLVNDNLDTATQSLINYINNQAENNEGY